jgi:hypothetical protein
LCPWHTWPRHIHSRGSHAPSWSTQLSKENNFVHWCPTYWPLLRSIMFLAPLLVARDKG